MNRRDMLKATAAAGALLSTGAAMADTRKSPTLVFRRSKARGHANHGWLNARHSFSFSSYQDPKHMGFRALRVINEDYIAGGRGFPMHPHNDMEIITYVLDGALQHRDSLGNGSVIRPGEVQQMSAGTGIRHSEFNPLETKKTHLLQIWLLPDRRGYKPSYGQKRFALNDGKGLRLVASPDGRSGSIKINQDTNLYAGSLKVGTSVLHKNAARRHVWIQVARGEITINGQKAFAGDGIRTSEPGNLNIKAVKPAELLLFDLA